MSLEKKREFLLQLCQYGDTIKSDKELTQKVISERLLFIPHKKLYKFRPCEERHFQLLDENYIWMSPADSFVDLFDSTINIDLLKNSKDFESWFLDQYPTFCFDLSKRLFEDMGLSVPYTHADFVEYNRTCLDKNGDPIEDKERAFLVAHASPSELQQMDVIMQQLKVLRSEFLQRFEPSMSAIMDAISDMRTYTRKASLVYCMTERYDNHTLWETYADNYSGFCIEYSFEHFLDVPFSDYKNLAYMFPMTYRKIKPYFNVIPFVNGIFQQFIYKDETWKEDPELNADLNMQLYYKRKDYEYEHEWRFSIKNAGNSKQSFPFVHAIYVGHKISSNDLIRLHTIAQKIHVPIYQQRINNAGNGFNYIKLNE